MKNFVKAALFSAAVLFAVQGMAGTTTIKRDTSLTRKAGHEGKKIGHQISNTAANTESHIVDRKYKDKCGPHGETVYINKHSHYYYINKKGHRVYLKKSELMDKKAM
ncbi:MAG: hypothetical protein ACTHJ8_06260 [Mucilaginibacter sp.]